MLTETPPVKVTSRRRWAWIAGAGALLFAAFTFWLGYALREISTRQAAPAQAEPAASAKTVSHVSSGPLTNIYAHNLRLHQGPNFRVYIRWLRGEMRSTQRGVTPSFDDPESFYLNVTNGVIRANLGDINNDLNARAGDSPLKDIRMSGQGEQIKLTGKLHKVFTFPVELSGVIKPASNSRIQIHVTKINVLKMPFKAILGGLHVTVADFVHSGAIKGVEVEGNDIFFDPRTLLPPPHILGTLTKLSMGDPDLEATYGDASKDVERVEEWRNFLRLKHGTLAFGKLVMKDVDLMMIDISQDGWFDLDLANYQAQLVGGYTRMTPEAGLQIFMPDVSELKKTSQTSTDIQWFKNRNQTPPAEVLPKK